MRSESTTAFEVPKDWSVRLIRVLESIDHIPPLTACLGLTEDGRPLLLRLPSPDAGPVLIAGVSEAGKTELMQTMIVSLALSNPQSELQVVFVDPKNRGSLLQLMKLPHLSGLFTTSTSSLAILEQLADQVSHHDHGGSSVPHIVIAVDDVDYLLKIGGDGTRRDIVRILEGGRKAGIHLIVSARTPLEGSLTSLITRFPVRLVGKVGSADNARIASGQAGTGAEWLLSRGDFLCVTAGQTLRFQAAWIPSADWPKILTMVK